MEFSGPLLLYILTMNLGHLIEAPRLWPADSHWHRRVTWLEVFFDLIFVAAVAQVGSPLSTDYSPTSPAC